MSHFPIPECEFMTSFGTGALRNRKPLRASKIPPADPEAWKTANRSKRIEMGATKGHLRLGARPVSKDLLGKNHEAASFSWPRRAIRPNPTKQSGLSG